MFSLHRDHKIGRNGGNSQSFESQEISIDQYVKAHRLARSQQTQCEALQHIKGEGSLGEGAEERASRKVGCAQDGQVDEGGKQSCHKFETQTRN